MKSPSTSRINRKATALLSHPALVPSPHWRLASWGGCFAAEAGEAGEVQLALRGFGSLPLYEKLFENYGKSQRKP